MQVQNERKPENISNQELRRDMIEKYQNIYFEEALTMIAILDDSEADELTKAEKEFLLHWTGDDDYAHVDDDGKIIY